MNSRASCPPRSRTRPSARHTPGRGAYLTIQFSKIGPDTLTIAELAVALGHGKRTVERLLRDHPEQLPKPLPQDGWQRYWNRDDVDAWLIRHLRHP